MSPWKTPDEGKPAKGGIYPVVIAGDSESVDGHVIYSFKDYQTWFYVRIGEDGEVTGYGFNDEDWSMVIYWLDTCLPEPPPFPGQGG